MTDPILIDHLLAAHPGARYPWYANGYIKAMPVDALERLHAELVAQGEDCQVVAEGRPNWKARLARVEALGAA